MPTRLRHDSVFKTLFSHPTFVQQLMEGFVPASISQQLDYSTLKSLPGNYVTPTLAQRLQDVVWSVKWRASSNRPQGNEADVYLCILLEFQSANSEKMPVRMLQYVAAFYDQLISKRALKLPRDRLPLVVHKAKRTIKQRLICWCEK